MNSIKQAFDSSQPNQIYDLVNFIYQLPRDLNSLKDNLKPLDLDFYNVFNEEWKLLLEPNYGIRSFLSQISWKHFDPFCDSLMQQTPVIEMATILPPLSQKEFENRKIIVEFNNYGIRPDSGSVVIDPTNNKIISFRVDGKEFSLSGNTVGTITKKNNNENLEESIYSENRTTDSIDQEQRVYLLKGNVIYDSAQKMVFDPILNGKLNCDQSNIKKLNSGAVLMTLCDGCGPGSGSQLAAKTVLEFVEGQAELRFSEVKNSHDVAKN